MFNEFEIKQATDCLQAFVLVVQVARELAIGLVVSSAHGVLQFADRSRIPLMQFAVASPVKIATNIKWEISDNLVTKRQLVLLEQFVFNLFQANAFKVRSSPGEIFLHEIAVTPDGLENLSAFIAFKRRDSHLRHHLENAAFNRLFESSGGFASIATEPGIVCHLRDTLKRQPWINRVRAISDQRAKMMDSARLSCLKNKRCAGTETFPDQVVMQGAKG